VLPPRPRPKTKIQRWPVTEQLCDDIRAELAARGLTQADLAKGVGVTHPLISTILSGRVRSSEYVPAIHEFFGWPPPKGPTRLSERQQRWAALYERLEEQGQLDAIDSILRLGDTLSPDKKK
jgi:transcriptional regulator with XRE-family HTH domain